MNAKEGDSKSLRERKRRYLQRWLNQSTPGLIEQFDADVFYEIREGIPRDSESEAFKYEYASRLKIRPEE